MRRARRLRRFDRLHQGRQRLARDADGSRQFQVTTHRRLRRRLPGRRRHDDRADRRAAAPPRPRRATSLADFDTPVSDTAPAPAKQFYGPVRAGDLARRHEGRLHVLLALAEPERHVLPAHVHDDDQRGRHRLLARRPADELGRARPRLPLRLAPSVVGRQRHDDARRTRPTCPNHDVDPRPHQRRRQRPRQHGHELVQRHATTTRTSAAGTSRATSARWRSRRARNDSTLTVYFVPEFPTAWRDGNPIGSDAARAATATRARSAAPSACRPGRRTASASPTTTPTASTSRPSRPSRAAARTEGATPIAADRHPGRQGARLGPGRRPARPPGGRRAYRAGVTGSPAAPKLSVEGPSARLAPRRASRCASRSPARAGSRPTAKSGTKVVGKCVQERQEGRQRLAEGPRQARGQDRRSTVTFKPASGATRDHHGHDAGALKKP